MEKIIDKLKKLYAKPFVRAGVDSAIIQYMAVFLSARGYQIQFVGFEKDEADRPEEEPKDKQPAQNPNLKIVKDDTDI